ncbi:MAG: SGNH/GDSL hydrolase family protein [Acidimicrobiaceae bacterium]|jgi:lysophospholipase L1-like esterase
MFLSRVRTVVAVAGVAALLGACTGSGRSGLTELQYVGRIPGINSAGGSVVVDGVRANLSSLEGTSLGSVAAGNRLLVIGDSILAGTASRYGGALCSAVVPLGWRVAVEAEAGQLVGFGRTVLRDRIYEGWDAAVVFLGTNYGGSKENYERDLTRIVESLAPRPTLLLTATLFRDSMQQVNEVIRVVASRNTHVSVLDWGTASVQPGLLNKDRVHPTNAGRAVLVSSIAAALGTAPETPGACLPAKFTDDSLVEDNVMPATTLPGDTIPYGTTPPVATTLPVVASTTTTVVSATTTTVRQ